MTCIVGLVYNDELTFMGADAALSLPGGTTQTILAEPKIFTIGNGDFLVGITGEWRLGQIMQYSFTPPPHNERAMSATEYMVTTFVDAMRRTVEKGGSSISVQGHERVGGSLLIAYRGRLFVVSRIFDIVEADAPFHAVGSGAQAALGALYATQGRDPSERIMNALDAAEYINTTVRRPFRILCQHQRSRIIEVVDYSVEECHVSAAGDTSSSAA
jgi:hypothetical protein